MEQNNLVVTSDGKTWDEVTRDTSYIGNVVVATYTDTAYGSAAINIFDEWRGEDNILVNSKKPAGNKDSFAIGYDRMICLVEGYYDITFHMYSAVTSNAGQILINGVTVAGGAVTAAGASSRHNSFSAYLKRGDYVQAQGTMQGTWSNYTWFQISKTGSQ